MIETVDDIKTIANVGTGTMGHAITLQFALAGYPVHLVGRGEASLEKAMKAIRSDAEDFAEAGLLKDATPWTRCWPASPVTPTMQAAWRT